ncbi:hypothetical protein [Nostoc sp.]|uniref:hypothetical protein n=1 Tax=Nostoc sp. TaxID=1180 RepID=UPI002FFA9F7B
MHQTTGWIKLGKRSISYKKRRLSATPFLWRAIAITSPVYDSGNLPTFNQLLRATSLTKLNYLVKGILKLPYDSLEGAAA